MPALVDAGIEYILALRWLWEPHTPSRWVNARGLLPVSYRLAWVWFAQLWRRQLNGKLAPCVPKNVLGRAG